MSEELNADIAIRDGLTIPARELQWRFSCAGGPGGQNVNKVASKATLIWDLAASEAVNEFQRARLDAQLPPSTRNVRGEVHVTSSEERDQASNRRLCREKFASLVLGALKRQKPRKRTRPTRASKERRIVAKKQRGQLKADRRKRWD